MFFSDEKAAVAINRIVDIKNNFNLTKYENIKEEKQYNQNRTGLQRNKNITNSIYKEMK